PAHIKGYQYIRSSVLLSLRDGSMLNFVTKSLYPEVAKIYGTTTGSVERAIRHAIVVAWERGNREAIKQLYGYDYGIHSRRPTNSEFLSLVVDKFRMEEKNHVQAAG
ncbi:MAG: sporulation initiation factor Spo0A C-terminal domain-containing protein, partial [Lachnospiraceae bacterium]|nr:sporulation initiation factor Spo0A C-terminal domain-containing protein [Lachnospiraceae bacterium]